jgi:hypothetical protein
MVKVEEHTGNIWSMLPPVTDHSESGSWAVVPVNQLGVMGAGLAKEAYSRFPKQCQDDIAARKEQCSKPHTQQVLVRMYPPLIFFPTKWDWAKNADLQLIAWSLDDLTMELVKEVEAFKKPIRVAMPHIGCGLGHLQWDVIRYMIRGMVYQLSLFELATDITITLVSWQ